ncbi:hypothetical protein TI04_08315 [Achromatium sp. WMS2]|nr:hypothetical protein TI04_08315 [Achromatium sp. WMS2]
MAEFLKIHPEDPQPRLIKQAAEIVRNQGLIVYPTDSTYAFGCGIGNKDAMERIRSIRRLDKDHHFALVCSDLSEIANYAKVDNQAYRLLRTFTPGAYTFILQATKQVPKRLQHPKRKTIGIRVPNHPVAQALLTELRQPLLSSTLQLPGDELPLNEPFTILETLGHSVDLIINIGTCGLQVTTMIDLSSESPQILRSGKGDTTYFHNLT